MTRLLSTGFGLVMVAAAVISAGGAALAAAGVAAAAVLAANAVRWSATLAVVAAGATLLLAGAAPAQAAVCGLAATIYLVLRHTGEVTSPTVVAMLGFSAVALSAAMIPLQLPWLPLLAPPAVVAAVAVAISPLWDLDRN